MDYIERKIFGAPPGRIRVGADPGAKALQRTRFECFAAFGPCYPRRLLPLLPSSFSVTFCTLTPIFPEITHVLLSLVPL